MRNEQLRAALKAELKGDRDVEIAFLSTGPCVVPNAMLVPDEEDHLVKLTDGKHVYIIDAENVDWIKIG